jgi:membrane fusion protein (multidrug efflux system)
MEDSAGSGFALATPETVSGPRKLMMDVQQALPARSLWSRLWPHLARAAVLALAVAMVIVCARSWNRWIGAAVEQSTDDAYLQGDLTPLGSHVGGIVLAVPVRDFQRVQAGDLLVQIDDRDYRAQLAQAEANLAAAEAAILNNRSQQALQGAQIDAALAALQATEADLVRAQLEDRRQRSLLAGGIAGTRQTVEQTAATVQRDTALLAQNQAQLEAARQQLVVLGTMEKQLSAARDGQAALRDLAAINLGYTRIMAPVAGMVGQRQVRPGQYVGIGTQLIAIVPLPHLWVLANLKETQVTRLRLDQMVTVTVDSFPDKVLRGRVSGWSPASGAQFSLLPPDNATGNFTKVVQRIPVRIELEDKAGLEDLLRPGMSVIATIHTDSGGL